VKYLIIFILPSVCFSEVENKIIVSSVSAYLTVKGLSIVLAEKDITCNKKYLNVIDNKTMKTYKLCLK
jgi:hypothetical protein